MGGNESKASPAHRPAPEARPDREAHLKSPEGAIFVNESGVGRCSFHFDRLVGSDSVCYMCEHEAPDLYFTSVSPYDEASRKMKIGWGFDYYSRQYDLFFNEDITEMSGKVIHDTYSMFSEEALGTHKRLDAQATIKFNEEKAREALSTAPQAYKQDSSRFTLFFLDADRLRSWRRDDGPLKSFQELQKEPGWLIAKLICFGRLLRGKYASGHAVVSHRWKRAAHPDKDCKQLERLCEWMNKDANRTIRFLWIDYSCLPQGKRTKVEKAYFDSALNVINMLFIGFRVLILLDRSYFNCFWCNYEAFLAMQTAYEEGVKSAEDDSRYSILCLGAARAAEQRHVAALCDWNSRTTKEALDILANDDIEVTSQSDKTKQIEKLGTMSSDLKNLWTQTQRKH